MFPIGDENLRGRGPAILTLVIIGINVAVFVLLQLPSDAFTYGWSAIPREITTGRRPGRARAGHDRRTVVLDPAGARARTRSS